MKILVTGSNGYIGKHLCKMLHANHEIYGLDLQENCQTLFTKKYFQINIDEQFKLYDKFDCVVHLAALVRVGESVSYPTKYYKTNIIGTTNVLNGVRFKNFIFGSTGAAANPTSPYAVSKIKAEEIVEDHCKKNDKKYTMFRFYNVTGSDGYPATNPDGLFFKLNEAIKTNEFNIYGSDYDTPDGTAIRDYVHVNEICYAIKTAIDRPSNSVENLGHGKGYSVKEIVKTFQSVNDVKFNVNIKNRREGDPSTTILDNVSEYMKNIYSLEDYMKIS